MSFHIGQRWYSSTEPDLGLGIIEKIEGRQILVRFPAHNINRRYAQNSAPLNRVILSIGQTIRSTTTTFEIEKIETQNQLLVYSGAGKIICETDLDPSINVSTPENRLYNMQFDKLDDFEIRQLAVQLNYNLKSSPLRGFFGGRINLLDHQLSVAHRACSQNKVRVLLGDEVGLGKTIEALLIMHRLLLDNRINSAIIVVPSSLVHQWLAEAYLKFNLTLRVLGVEAYHGAQEDYLEEALIDANLFVVPLEKLSSEIIGQEWDLLILDEAHHLTPDHESWTSVTSLSKRIRHCLFLSATPDRNSEKGHIARIALLEQIQEDQVLKHHSKNKFLTKLADAVYELQSNHKRKPQTLSFLEKQLGESSETIEKTAPNKTVNRLFDIYGLGRTRFRNTRSNIPNFPKRCGHHTVLENGDLKLLRKEFIELIKLKPNFELNSLDTRINWLKNWILNNRDEKVLILCATSSRADTLAKALIDKKREVIVFHEDMGLLERDRHAAPFLDPNGPRIAIISPIGAEGRNFQIASHLIIFDLPWGADRMEQAIGRIDRIGQTKDVHIHTLSFEGSPQYGLVQWYNETLNIFEKPWHGSSDLELIHSKKLLDALLNDELSGLDEVIKFGGETNVRINKEIADGRDRLLELSSFDPILGSSIQESLLQRESDRDLEHFIMKAFEYYGMTVEYIGDRSFDVRTSEANYHPIPGWIGESMIFTFDRDVALIHPERTFLNPDHPMLRDLLDLFLSSPKGNTALAQHSEPNTGILIEAQFIAQPPANVNERILRFWTPTPIEVAIDEKENHEKKQKIENLKPMNKKIFFKPSTMNLIKKQIEKMRAIAEKKARMITENINKRAIEECSLELKKLDSIRSFTNQSIRADREYLQKELSDIQTLPNTPRLRLDAIRISLPSRG